MNEAQKRDEGMVAIHRMVVLIDEQAPPVEADEDDLTEENTLDLSPYEVVRTMDALDAELVPWLVNEELGGL